MYLCLDPIIDKPDQIHMPGSIYIIRNLLYRHALFITLLAVPFLLISGSLRAATKENQIAVSRDSLKIIDSIIPCIFITQDQRARTIAFKGLLISKRLKDREKIAQSYFNLGMAFYSRDPGIAYGYFMSSYRLTDRRNPTALLARIYYSLGLISFQAYENQETVIWLDSSISTAVKCKEYTTWALSLNLMCNILIRTNDNLRAIMFVDSAIRVAKTGSKPYALAVALVNKSTTESDPAGAFILQKQALELLGKIPGAEKDCAEILVEIGYSAENPDTSKFYLELAINKAKMLGSDFIQISAYNNLAYAFLQKKDIDKAISCLADHAIPLAEKLMDHDLLSTVYDSYAEMLNNKGDVRKALEFQKKGYVESVLASSQSNAKQVSLLASIMEMKQKDAQIKNARETIRLQEATIVKTRLVSAIIILVLLLLIILTILLIQRMKGKFQKKQIESARKIITASEAEINRISMDLHDNLGPFFQSFGIQLDSIKQYSPKEIEKMENQMNVFWGEIRQITHKMNNKTLSKNTLEESLYDIVSGLPGVAGWDVNLNFDKDCNALSDELRLHIFRIVQELFTNAKKYALAGKIFLTLSTSKTHLSLFYLDSGPGFDKNNSFGMGISNIFERVQLMNGNSILETKTGSPTSFEINIPLKNQRSVKHD